MAAEFKEVGRMSLDEGEDIVISEIYRDETFHGWTINKYLKTERYTGFVKGITIPDGFQDEFSVLVRSVMTIGK